jgi:hypothetical protein
VPIRIVPKAEVAPELIAFLSVRIAAPEHTHDNGACRSWSGENTTPKLCVVFLDCCGKDEAIGVLFADGPPDATGAAWWLDSRYRQKGLGSEMIDAYAVFLKARGVTGIRSIAIDTFAGKYHEESSSLARRLREHFE